MITEDMTYYGLYLKNYLQEQDDERAYDDDFITERADMAAELFERCRRDGLSVWQSQERAIHSLTEGLND